MKLNTLVELEANLSDATKALRSAWWLMKKNGMEDTAKEIADTALDVALAADLVKARIDPVRQNKEAQKEE